MIRGPAQAFLDGLRVHGRRWARISHLVQTRSADQVRSHAQKYFKKLSKATHTAASPPEALASTGAAAREAEQRPGFSAVPREVLTDGDRLYVSAVL